jgi:hypothetical protein
VSLLVDEFAAWLETQGEGTVGATIFRLQRPSSPAACISLHGTGGYPPETYGVREHPTLQIVCRATTPNGALQKAYSVFNRIPRKSGLDLGDLYAFTVEAMGSPAYIGEEQAAAQTCHLASFNLVFDLRRPSS